MILNGLDELQTLSVNAKVAQMLRNHQYDDHPLIVEFTIDLAKKAKDVDHFLKSLEENESEFDSEFAEQLYRIIIALDPPKKVKCASGGGWDSVILGENDTSVNFPALALKNSQPTRPELQPPEARQEGELSEWAQELLKKEAKGHETDNRQRRAPPRRHRSRSRSSTSSDSLERRHKRNDRRRKSTSRERHRNYRDRSRSSSRGSSRRRHRPFRDEDRRHDKRIDAQSRRERNDSPSYDSNYPKLNVFGVYKGKVTTVMDYGAFVRFSTNQGPKQGLVHVSELRQGSKRIEDVSSVIQQHQDVYVRVLAIVGDKIDLSMKNVDQVTGEYNADVTLLGGANSKSVGSITGVSLDDYVHGIDGKRHKLVSDLERWEQQQMLKSGILSAEERQQLDIVNEARVQEQEIEVEVNNACPRFLKGQTARSGIDLSPIRVVSNPEGSLARAIATSATMARERRQSEKAQEDAMISAATKEGDEGFDQPNRHSEAFSMANWKRQNMGKPCGPPPTHKSIKEVRESLPIYKLRDELLQAIRENDILIVVGETGSGKSTQIPQYLAETGYSVDADKNIKIIGCTQPRRVAAISVAKRVAEEVGCRLGQEVGYCIRFEDCTTRDTSIKYMTDGMLLREVLQDPLLQRYSVVMLDEAHERTISTDVLFALLKECCYKRNDFKLIVTSATLEAEKFSSYFNDASIFSIPGRTFPVTIFHTKEQEPDYLEAALHTVINIHLEEHEGDILLFLTGQEEIDTACRSLNERMKKMKHLSPPPLIVLPVYAALPSEMQSAIFEPTPPGCRKCVVATNIAEASLTIDGIYFVVDPGFAKVKRYNPRTGMESLVVIPISQANAKQRAGRAGRTGPGKCYRLYTEAAFRLEMLPTAVPEIQRTNLANVVILLKAMGINDFINFDFMDKPPVETLIDALDNLYHLGALDEDGLLTRLGRKMAEFPMDPNLAKMLLTSVDLNCSDEIITIVSMLSIQNIFYRPPDKQAESDRCKSKFTQAQGDHLTLLTVYQAWQRHKYSNLWCHENFIQGRALLRAQDIRKQLITIMDRYKFKIVSNSDPQAISKAVCSGFFHHSAKRDPQEGYRTLIDAQQVYIHPSSALYGKSPEYVVYHELVMTTKEYMRDLTLVKPQWLLELAPSMFKQADGSTVSKVNQRVKIEPLSSKFQDKDAWRISRRRG